MCYSPALNIQDKRCWESPQVKEKSVTLDSLVWLKDFVKLAGWIASMSVVGLLPQKRQPVFHVFGPARQDKTKHIASGDLLAICSLKWFWEEIHSGYSHELYCRRNRDSKGINNTFLLRMENMTSEPLNIQWWYLSKIKKEN